MEPITRLTIGSMGGNKTCKTSFGLTLPKPLIMLDLDFGYDRAEARFVRDNPKLHILRVGPVTSMEGVLAGPPYDMVVKRYNTPVRLPGVALAGFTSLVEDQILPDIMMAYQTSWVSSVFVDTGTILWEAERMAQLERVQTAAAKKGRTEVEDRMIQREYGRPNLEMRAILSASRVYGKHMVISHHLRDVYVGDKPDVNGATTWAGFKEVGQLVDTMVRNGVEATCLDCKTPFPDSERGAHLKHRSGNPVPAVTIEFCGYTLAANGMKLYKPTYELVLQMVNAMRLA